MNKTLGRMSKFCVAETNYRRCIVRWLQWMGLALIVYRSDVAKLLLIACRLARLSCQRGHAGGTGEAILFHLPSIAAAGRSLHPSCCALLGLFWCGPVCFDTHRQNSQTVLISPSAERENDLAGQWNFLAPALAVKCLGRGVVHSKNRKNPQKIQGFFWGFKIPIPYFGVENSSNSLSSNPILFIKSSYTKK